MEATPWVALLLGLLLGVRHAFDADHLVAVSTIVSEYRNPLRAVWVGVSWGLGHTTTLFLAGIVILVAHVSLPNGLALTFEFLVGVMLVVLGLQIFWGFRKGRVHLHAHEYDRANHQHFHSHEATTEHAHHRRVNWSNFAYFLIAGITPGEHGSRGLVGPGRPFFRLKSYVVGTVHGLAGSATLLLLVLASMSSPWTGALYVLLFGLGSVVSMGIITVFISLPFTASARLPRVNRVVQTAAATLSIVFGLLLMYEIGVVEGLFRAS